MSQTIAMLVDSYRELNARKLFWITLALSAMVVLVFLGLGIDEKGLYFFGLQIPGIPFTTEYLSRPLFYRFIFLGLGVNMWLSFVAAVLGLISTGGIFPDLLTGGSIDLYLSKPISRPRVFITKYFTGLLFVALQVGVFSFASFIVLRIRGGEWVPAVFMAIPAVLAYFSYIYSICVLLGVMTRSTVAAILITILFTFSLWGVYQVESGFLTAEIKSEMVLKRLAGRTHPDPIALKKAEEDVAWTRAWHKRIMDAEFVLPKTVETTALMQRWVISSKEFQDLSPDDDEQSQPPLFGWSSDEQRAKEKTAATQRARSLNWTLGTSFMFEGIVVCIAGWIFCRRDY